MTDAKLDMWVEERNKDITAQRYRVVRSLYSGQSDLQKVDVVETAGLGVMLFLDGLAMVSERDEFIYHDMISHVPLYVHPNPRRVLVIGGGDGGTAREVMRHPQVERCVMVEIDGKVVDVSKQFIPQTAIAFENPKLDLIIGDGVKYVMETDETFDVVLVDSTDPIGPAKPLFGEAFYSHVHRILADDGIAVAQGESPYYEAELQRTILKSVKANFPKVHLYNYTNLTYPCGMWSFVFTSKGLCPVRDLDHKRVAADGLKFSYYNTGIHQGAFCLPQFQWNLYDGILTPLDPFAR